MLNLRYRKPSNVVGMVAPLQIYNQTFATYRQDDAEFENNDSD